MAIFFCDRLKSHEIGSVYCVDDYGNLILIMFYLYCCSEHKLTTILVANVGNLAR